MDTKSDLLLYLASKLGDRALEFDFPARKGSSPNSAPAVSPEVVSLREKLQAVRERSLAACRAGDYRTQARLTAEAAKLTKALREADGLPVFAEEE
jgi:hypothetical protein